MTHHASSRRQPSHRKPLPGAALLRRISRPGDRAVSAHDRAVSAHDRAVSAYDQSAPVHDHAGWTHYASARAHDRSAWSQDGAAWAYDGAAWPHHRFARSPVPPQDRFRRALRLFVALGSCVAGLCLVVGLVALVAGGAPPTSAANVAATSTGPGQPLGSQGPAPEPRGLVPAGQAAPSRHHGGGPALLRPAAGGAKDVIRTVRDHRGNGAIPRFSTSGRPWRLDWAYQCQGSGGPGRLLVRDLVAAPARTILDVRGQAGRSLTRAYRAPGRHNLRVTSGCTWTIQVRGRR
jgi:hypothetical protein